MAQSCEGTFEEQTTSGESEDTIESKVFMQLQITQ